MYTKQLLTAISFSCGGDLVRKPSLTIFPNPAILSLVPLIRLTKYLVAPTGLEGVEASMYVLARPGRPAGRIAKMMSCHTYTYT